jgi:hypothetical protein
MDCCTDSSDSSYYKLSLRGSKVNFFYFPSSKCVITNISGESVTPPTTSTSLRGVTTLHDNNKQRQ